MSSFLSNLPSPLDLLLQRRNPLEDPESLHHFARLLERKFLALPTSVSVPLAVALIIAEYAEVFEQVG